MIGIRPALQSALGAGPHSAPAIVSNQWLGDQSHLALDVAGKLLVAVSHAPIAAKAGESVRLRFGRADLSRLRCGDGVALSHGLEAAR